MRATRRALVERRKTAGYSQEKLAERLRVEPSTIGRWERGETEPQPWHRPRLAKALGVQIDELSRLLLVVEEYDSGSAAVQVADLDHVDRFAWEDDLDHAHALFARQSFATAKQLVERWLLRRPGNGSEQTLYLRARSHHLLGNILRDEGVLLGLTSATTEYRRARQLYHALGCDRRVAQVELWLGVVSEMRLDHARALTVYRAAQNDDRLSPVDKARGLLWQGTVLTKQRQPEQAIPTILAAIEAFERNESATDWESAHQKLALAYVHTAHFDLAAEAFEIPLASITQQTPLERVQLTVARAHLSITAGQQDVAAQLLDQSEVLAREYGLRHQLTAMQGVRDVAQRQCYTTPVSMSILENPMTDPQIAADAHLLWEYHQLNHALREADLVIGLGSSDFDVPEEVARVYNEGYAKLVSFTGASSRTTRERYPKGEAMEFRDRAVELGVPTDSILLETEAKNTGENFTFTRDLVQAQGHAVASIIVACMPYMQRRAYATCKKVWSEVEVMCTSKAMRLTDYIAKLANAKKVLDDLTGDTWRVLHYPEQGFAIPQDVPDDVQASLERLIAAGFTGRLQDKVHRDALTDPLRDTSP